MEFLWKIAFGDWTSTGEPLVPFARISGTCPPTPGGCRDHPHVVVHNGVPGGFGRCSCTTSPGQYVRSGHFPSQNRLPRRVGPPKKLVHQGVLSQPYFQTCDPPPPPGPRGSHIFPLVHWNLHCPWLRGWTEKLVHQHFRAQNPDVQGPNRLEDLVQKDAGLP